MTGRRRLAALLVAVIAGGSGAARAQSFVTQPQSYLLTVDATDARSLWLQPAGLSRRREAAFAGMVTTGAGEVTQYGLTLQSAGLGLGWQHDRRSGAGTDVFSVGFGLGGPLLGLGADHRWYRGAGVKDGSWDIGARAMLTPALELSAVWRDVGTPVFFVDPTDTARVIRPTLVPAAALNLFDRVRLAGEWEIVTEGWSTSAYRVGASAYLGRGLALTLRGDLTPGLSAHGAAISLTWGGFDTRATGFAASQRGADGSFGAWLASVRDLTQNRPGRGFR